MFIIKDNYYLYIENTKTLNLNYIKKNKKISIIYRNNDIQENYINIKKFRKKCRYKKFKFYVANNYKLAKYCHADGLYLSSYNKKIYLDRNLKVIGSAHSFKEINEKVKQGCDVVILSRLFKTSYKNKKSYLGTTKFNLMKKNFTIDLSPLGGINSLNLLKLNLVTSRSLCLFSEIKKKPAITSRLF